MVRVRGPRAYVQGQPPAEERGSQFSGLYSGACTVWPFWLLSFSSFFPSPRLRLPFLLAFSDLLAVPDTENERRAIPFTFPHPRPLSPRALDVWGRCFRVLGPREGRVWGSVKKGVALAAAV